MSLLPESLHHLNIWLASINNTIWLAIPGVLRIPLPTVLLSFPLHSHWIFSRNHNPQLLHYLFLLIVRIVIQPIRHILKTNTTNFNIQTRLDYCFLQGTHPRFTYVNHSDDVHEPNGSRTWSHGIMYIKRYLSSKKNIN